MCKRGWPRPLILAAALAALILLFQLGERPPSSAMPPAQDWLAFTFTGNVYKGQRGDTSTPLPGAVVSLWCSSEQHSLGERLATAVSSPISASFSFSTTRNCTYFHLVETDPPGYRSTGAIPGEPGQANTSNWIYYHALETARVYGGNKFFDVPVATATPTATPTPELRTWVVNTTSDHDDGRCQPLSEGDCTLREAMREANERPGADTILFDIPTADPGYSASAGQWTIQPQSPLPALSDADSVLSGGTPSGACPSRPPIVLDGAASAATGIEVTGANQAIQGLVIRGWVGAAVWIHGPDAHHNRLACNEIVGNVGCGVRIGGGAHHNAVGLAEGQGNLLAGNAGAGVQIRGQNSTGNVVSWNRIGTNAAGLDAWPNASGVVIEDACANTVGPGNLISGNQQDGVQVQGVLASDNEVRANRIGTDATGAAPLPNGEIGVHIWEAQYTTVGPDNVVSGNGGTGVFVGGPSGRGNVVKGNAVGLDAGRTARLGNARFGVEINDEAHHNLVGPDNVIGGNHFDGVHIGGAASSNSVTGNAIGTDLSGALDLHNDGAGITICCGAVGNYVGLGPSLNLGNLIARNTGSGVAVFDRAVRNRLTWNQITENGGRGIVTYGGGNDELAPPAINVAGPFGVSGTSTCGPGCTVEVFSDPADEGAQPEGQTTTQADGSWAWAGSPAGPYVTANVTDPQGNSSEFSPAMSVATLQPPPLTHIFAGTVLEQQGGSARPLRGARVSLYGSQNGSDWGDPLAMARTAPDGTFVLDVHTRGDLDLPFYALAANDPNYEVVDAVPGPGGDLLAGHRVRFAGPAAGAHLENRFTVRGTLPIPIPLPPEITVPLWWEPSLPPPHLEMPVDLFVEGIEVTQATQCFDKSQGYTLCPDNALELASGKDTLVRVYVGCTGCSGDSLAGLTVTLDWKAYAPCTTDPCGGASWFSAAANPQTFNAPLGKTLQERRNDDKGAANYYLKAPTGGYLYANAFINYNKKIKETNYDNNKAWVFVTLHQRQPLKVQWLPVEYRPATYQQDPSKSYTGPPFVDTNAAGSAAREAKNMYPMPVDYSQAKASFLYGSNPAAGVTCNDCPDVRDNGDPLGDKLSKLYASGGLSPKPDSLVGWLPVGAAGGNLCRGLGGPPVAWIAACSWASGNESLLSHELGHTRNLWHMDQPGKEPHWPFPGNYEIKETGYDVGAKQLYKSHVLDFMHSTSGTWISPYNWNKLLGKTYAKQWAKTGSGAAMSWQTAPRIDDRAAQAVAEAAPGPAIVVSGWVEGAGARFDTFYQFPSHGPFPASDPGGDYALDFQAQDGSSLARHYFRLPPRGSAGWAASSASYFSFLLPMPVGTTRVVLRQGATVLTERVASRHTPTVSVVEPRAGEVISGTRRIAWTAADADEDPLHCAVLYSPDGGASWWPLALDIQGTGIDIDSAFWAGGDSARVRVLASDGFNAGMADSGAFQVPRKAPNAWISAPESGTVIDRRAAIILSGHAEDLEDGQLSGSSLTWSSDRQGILGSGAQFALPPQSLVSGRHQITLLAIDSDGRTGTATIGIAVELSVHLPLLMRGH